MARVTLGPLVSDVSGKTAGSVFSRWKGRNYVRRLVTPANPQSVAQTAQRNAMARCVILWRFLAAWVKTALDEVGIDFQMSGYNWFCGQNVVNEKTYDSGKLMGHNPESAIVEDFAAAAGGASEITVTWTDPTLTNVTHCSIFYRLVESASEDAEFTFDSHTAVATETKTITGLNTGEDYRVVAMFTNADQSIVGESDSDELAAG